MARDTDQVLAGLLADLPKGWAWRRDPLGVGAGLQRPHAAELAALEAGMEALLAEADPRTTTLLIDEWERAFGLPDECSGDPTSLTERRVALIARLVAGGGPTLATFYALAQVYGVTASITEHRPHTCEDHCEYPVYDEPWAFAWTMFSPVGEGLPHECAVRRIAPAYTVPIFGTYRRLWSFFFGLLSGATLRRPGGAPYYDCRGLLKSAAADVARFDYDPSLTYNQVPNPWGDGAPPTNWLVSGAGGITPTFLSAEQRDGIFYTRWRVQGTGTSSGFPNIRTALVGDIPAMSGDAFSAQAHVEVVRVGAGNTAAAPTTATLDIAGYTSGGAAAESTSSPAIGTRTFADGPLRAQRTMTAGTTASALLRLTIPNATGAVHDWDIDIGFPIVNAGLSYLADAVPLATLANRLNSVPQYGLIGLLVEPSEAEQLILGMPDGTYDMTVKASTVNVAGTSYEAEAVAIGGLGYAFVWPPAAVTAGERHINTITLVKVS